MTETNELGRPIPELGKIERMEVRDIWLNEAHDFTPWLANRLDLLGDALGMELEIVQREAAVGPFSLDILAQDSLTGEMVAIENQLEWTDHTHLGQILVYAAGRDARTVIWVTPHFREEHRAAIDWLNHWTPEEIAFFGVEVSAIRIGESLPAPEFRPVAFPNGWAKRAKQTATSGASLDSQKRIQFFQPVVDTLRSKYGYSMHAQARSWRNPVQSGVSKIAYHPHLVSKGPSVYVEIWTGDRERDEQIYEALHEEKTSIEEALPLPLTWAKTKTLTVTMRGGKSVSVDDPPEKLQEARDWLLDNLPKFMAVLNPRLERIVGELQDEHSVSTEDEAPEGEPDA